MLHQRSSITIAFLAAVTGLVTLAFAAADPWTTADLLTPEQFAPVVAKGAHPPVYYVGFNVLYRSKHIPRAVYAGPGAESASRVSGRETNGFQKSKSADAPHRLRRGLGR